MVVFGRYGQKVQLSCRLTAGTVLKITRKFSWLLLAAER